MLSTYNTLQSNVEVVKQFCKAFELQDRDSCLQLCDDDIVWVSTRAEGGACIGKKQIFDEYLPQFYDHFKEFCSVHDEFLDAGESVVVLGKYLILSKAGEKLEAQFAQIYALRGGKIAKFRQYADSAVIQRAMF